MWIDPHNSDSVHAEPHLFSYLSNVTLQAPRRVGTMVEEISYHTLSVRKTYSAIIIYFPLQKSEAHSTSTLHRVCYASTKRVPLGCAKLTSYTAQRLVFHASVYRFQV